MAKDKYEISLWQDELVTAHIQDEREIPTHYEEKKLAIIGSDSITSPCRAYNPKLVENINGTNTLTFEMPYVYVDIDGEKKQNPFLSLLTNERKVKCFWKNKWYDFVIKNCQEDSTGKKITYTCNDLYVNELSKNGFSLTFDPDLKNNSGTAVELAKKVLEGTDWQVAEESSDIIQQEKEEPVYEVTLLNDLSATNDTRPQEDSSTINAGKNILIFYTQLQDIITTALSADVNQEISLQFAYANNYSTEKNSQLVVNADCYSINSLHVYTEQEDNIKYLQFDQDERNVFKLFYTDGVSSNYRAKRLVKSKISEFDPVTKKYCNKLIAQRSGSGYSKDDEIYEYSTSEWDKALTVQNLIVNNKNFTSIDSWRAYSEGTVQPKLGLYSPSTSEEQTIFTGIGCLGLGGKGETGTAKKVYVNDGLRHMTQYLPEEGFVQGDAYIVRFKIQTAKDDSPFGPSGTYITAAEPTNSIEFQIKEYKDSGETERIFEVTNWSNGRENWVEARVICLKSIAKKEFYTKNIGIFITNNFKWTRWVEEFQFFKEIINDGVRINPGDFDISTVSQVVYKYYNHTKNEGKINSDEIDYLFVSSTPWTDNGNLKPQYNENFEKVRSITAKQSNRFNILQSIAETFECWIQFDIEHDESGRTIYIDGLPKKIVRIKKDIGEETGVGFIYGIDLKSISRTIQSDQIVTKTIVSSNNNEFATNGSCNIARSIENYPKVNYILNFDYYITHGLIDGRQLNNDLYDSTGDIGYYFNLHQYNNQYEILQEKLAALKTALQRQEPLQTTYNETYKGLESQIISTKEEIRQLAGGSTYEGKVTQDYIAANKEISPLNAKLIGLASIEAQAKSYKEFAEKINDNVARLNEQIEDAKAEEEQIIKDIKALDQRFYNKYSRFIQEGVWSSEDYIDDNLYFLDAQSVGYTSSRPQVSYNISVTRISGQEGFENKIFRLGDISFIQDTEFFGYVYINDVKTPYKEKVLVTQITSNFDNPSQDTFTVQNYKTQFEDLFQRITSTTQSLQYASGGYAKAANIIETDGTIKAETLQASIAMNEQIVYSAQNEMIVQDSTGITVTDASNPNKKTKITSSGLLISTDGGSSWKNAIRGEGIATQYLTAGNINVGSIVLLDGAFTSFRWDKHGIDAYCPSEGGGINLGKFVRFDHFGIYGVQTGQEFYPENENEIWNNAQFGMTWKGFFVKNKYDGHTVEVSSENDIQVLNGAVPVIKIGQLDAVENIYGIRISNASGAPVMETNNLGDLWLRNRLNISSTNGTNYNIGIGYLDKTKPDTEIHEVVNANNKFIVYEDGSMKATNGEFTGTIHATGGKIGNMTIGTVESAIANMDSIAEATKKLDISSKLGYNFKVEDGVSSPSALELVATPTAFTITKNGISWFGSNDFESWIELANGVDTYILTYENFKKGQLNSTYYIKAVATATDGTSYEKWTTIMSISDGKKGEDALSLVIISTKGRYFKNNQGSTTLIAQLFKGGQEIDVYEPYEYTYVWRDVNDSNWSSSGKTLTVTADDVNFSRTYICDVSKGGI